MKLMNFTVVNIIVDQQSKTIDVQKIDNVPVNIDQLFIILPEMIPSTIAGPQGQSVGKIASKIVSGGGAAITVEGTPKQVMDRIMNTFGAIVNIEKAYKDTGHKDAGHKNIDCDEPNCEEGPKTIKLVVPDHIEKSEKETPAED